MSNVFPVGAIYLSITKESPARYMSGTSWELLAEGKALWTASSGAGGTINAGLPNIVGSMYSANNTAFATNFTGAFYGEENTEDHHNYIGEGYNSRYINFDASRSNSIYGNSTTVQPPAIKVYAYKRVS